MRALFEKCRQSSALNRGNGPSHRENARFENRGNAQQSVANPGKSGGTKQDAARVATAFIVKRECLVYLNPRKCILHLLMTDILLAPEWR
jgi:hypothetical protein